MPGPSPRIESLARKYGRKYGIKPSVLLGLISVESGFNKNAVSPAGAKWLTQFIPSTAAAYGVHGGKGGTKSQIKGAAHYLSDLGYKKDPKLALSSYNAGPGNPGAAGNYAQMVLDAAKNYLGANKGGIGGGLGKLGGIGGGKGGGGGAPGMFDPMQDESYKRISTAAALAPPTPEGFEKSGEVQARGYELLKQMSYNRASEKAAKLSTPDQNPQGFGKMGPSKMALGGGAKSGIVGWAARQVGLTESSSKVAKWTQAYGFSPSTPWCSVFVAQALKQAGYSTPSDAPYSGAWLNWSGGKKVSLSKIKPGDIVVFDWGDGGRTDHVALYAGNGQVIGGNQSNSVSKVGLDRGAVVGVIRPGKKR